MNMKMKRTVCLTKNLLIAMYLPANITNTTVAKSSRVRMLKIDWTYFAGIYLEEFEGFECLELEKKESACEVDIIFILSKGYDSQIMVI